MFLNRIRSFLRIVSWRLIKGSIRLQFPEIEQLSTNELSTWLNNDTPQPLLLDARTEAEYRVSHLKNAYIVPDRLEDLADLEGVSYSTPIVVYCSVGYRSAAIACRLKSLGYQNVLNLSGSIFQWVNENRSVYRQDKSVNQVHPYNHLWQFLLSPN